jgi:hypothetical protein
VTDVRQLGQHLADLPLRDAKCLSGLFDSQGKATPEVKRSPLRSVHDRPRLESKSP